MSQAGWCPWPPATATPAVSSGLGYNPSPGPGTVIEKCFTCLRHQSEVMCVAVNLRHVWWGSWGHHAACGRAGMWQMPETLEVHPLHSSHGQACILGMGWWGWWVRGWTNRWGWQVHKHHPWALPSELPECVRATITQLDSPEWPHILRECTQPSLPYRVTLLVRKDPPDVTTSSAEGGQCSRVLRAREGRKMEGEKQRSSSLGPHLSAAIILVSLSLGRNSLKRAFWP